MMIYHYLLYFQVNMDTSKKEDFSLILLAKRKLKDLRKPRSVRIRKHFRIRLIMGELLMSFHHSINHPDEMLSFNSMRMSYIKITGI